MSTRETLDTLNDPARRSEGRYFGKYRGMVKDNKDPLGIGRILATLPAVPGMTLNWALPCSPYAGKDVGFYTIPPVGAKVWIEFEGGDPTYPLWSGCFWQKGEVPTEVQNNADDPSQVKVLKTRVATFWIDDTDQAGKITLFFEDDTVSKDFSITLVLDSSGVALTCKGSDGTSKITMTSQDINTDSTTLGTTTSKGTTITAQDSVTVTAQTDVTVKASGNVDISATSSASFQGSSCTITAKMDLTMSGTTTTMKGSTSVTVQSTGTLSMSATANATLSSVASTTVSGTASLSLGGASISFLPV